MMSAICASKDSRASFEILQPENSHGPTQKHELCLRDSHHNLSFPTEDTSHESWDLYLCPNALALHAYRGEVELQTCP